KLGFTEVTSVHRIFQVVLVRKFVGGNDQMSNSNPSRQLFRLFLLARGQAGTDGCDGDGILTTSQLSGFRDDRAVDAGRKRNRDATVTGKDFQQVFTLSFDIRVRDRHGLEPRIRTAGKKTNIPPQTEV